MATKFADITKGPRSVLLDDYTTKVSLKAKKNAGPVGVTFETEQGSDGSLSPKIAARFSYAKFNVDKGQIKADGGKVLETSLKLTPDVKLYFRASKGADLAMDYVKGDFFGTASMDVVDMSNITTSACYALSKHGVKVGGDARYNLSGGKDLFSSVNIGASYTTGPMFASVVATSKFSKYNLGLMYKVNDDLKIASQTSHSSSKMLDVVVVGAEYKASGIGIIKAKMALNGNVSACFIREIAPKVMLTASGSMSAYDPSTFKPGLGITM